MFLKCFVTFLVLCIIHHSQSKPTEDYITEGRGIGSTIWGWITYPFYWWGSSESKIPPENDHLYPPVVAFGPYDNIEIAKRNVTVWCNEQTCTTMKCDKYGCKNVTCSIYDTNFRGECREYNTDLKPEEPTTTQPVEVVSHLPTDDKVTESSQPPESITSAPVTSAVGNNQPIEERPTVLEAAISSTITEKTSEKAPAATKDKTSSLQNKI
ncbi:uncharacterized protein LOC126371815 [Pectinophora gossypiella]|uniref:uncharacterized protein LOC126371815 n=1 Tax=Pectinophora gossypiella TaxID=13191 RepID=UPI00214EE08C|nr:uncharacterized protein LOC126371815 [Pectinophora gossypiella]